MWSFFSKDPTKELVNFEIQEPVQLEPELQEKTIWSLNNAKRKGGPAAPNIPGATQAAEPLSTVFSYQMKPGNESWVSAAIFECWPIQLFGSVIVFFADHSRQEWS